MKFSRVMFSAVTEKWATPAAVYAALDAEFGFTLDPCPIGWQEGDTCGLSRSWVGERVYCNPPYGRGIGDWLAKASEAEVAVYLLPARTDTRWWHQYATRATDVRFIAGRRASVTNRTPPRSRASCSSTRNPRPR